MTTLNLSNIDVVDFLECLEVHNIDEATSEEIRFSCPFPGHSNEDDNPSAYMNAETTMFFCHSCKARGNAISFTEKALGVSPLEATRMLKERYQPGGINPDARDVLEDVRKILYPPEPEEIKQPVLDEEKAFSRMYPDEITMLSYMRQRGFSPQTIEDWQIVYDPISGRVALPVRDEHGNLIGFKARSIEGRTPKYIILGDKPNGPHRYGWRPYYPSKVVFGAHRIKKNVPELVVCEGEFNAIAITERTNLPAVAINGSNFTEYHAKIIRSLTDRAVIFFDNDAAGHAATGPVYDMLKPFIYVDFVWTDKDAADMTAQELEEVLAKENRPLGLFIAENMLR